MGYCPFPSLSHDTVHCIVTQGAGACSRVATTWPGGPATRPHDTTNMGHHTAGRAQGRRATTRAAWRAKGHDTKFCIMAKGGDLWVTIQRNKVAIRHRELQHERQRARHGVRQGLRSRYNFCIVTGRGDYTTPSTHYAHGLGAVCA